MIQKIKIPSSNTLLLMIAAFVCYTGMYAVRKSFLAGQYLDYTVNGINYKTILVISQIIGYMLSKFIGIKYVSELKEKNRHFILIGLVTFGLVMLLCFAFAPLPLKPFIIFLNGLPLGIVFGVVLSYLEGRRQTELLVAALSTTFIFSTGLIKSIGVFLIQQYQVNEYTMPFLTGLIFYIPFLISVGLLNRSRQRSDLDIASRSERVPMNKAERISFLKKYNYLILGLILIYISLTIIRDFRDNFIVEFWSELGYFNQPNLITLTEIPIALLILILSSLGILIQNNRVALIASINAVGISGLGILLATLLFSNSTINPILWIILSGTGIYLPYILFHCMVLERLIALFKIKGNIGFLFYIMDAMGYAGSVMILLIKELGNIQLTWLNFFVALNIIVGLFIVLLTFAVRAGIYSKLKNL